MPVYMGDSCLWSPTRITVLPYSIGRRRSRKVILLTSSRMTTSMFMLLRCSVLSSSTILVSDVHVMPMTFTDLSRTLL